MRTSLLWLQAIDLTKSDFFPTNWTGGHVVAFMAGRGKELKADPDGKLYWMREEHGRDGNLFWMREVTFQSMLLDRLSDSRYTECCGAASTALGCSPSRPTLARIVMHCLPPLSLPPGLHRDSSPSRYPAVNVLGSPRGGASRLKKRARQVSNVRPPA